MFSKVVISVAIALSALVSSLCADTYYTIAYLDDQKHEIQVEPLKGWVLEDEGDTPYDFKFVNRLENKTCYIFTGLEDVEILPSDLEIGSDQIEEMLYEKDSKSNHRIRLSSMQFLHSFDLVDQERTVAIVVYSIEQYLFGVVMETSTPESLINDCNAMIENVLLISMNR